MMFKVALYAALCACVSAQSLDFTANEITGRLGTLLLDLIRCNDQFLCDLTITSATCEVECINTTSVCDGIKDCKNGEDETLCPTRCPMGVICQDRFTCATPCNNVTECPDGADEKNCPPECPDGELLCNDQTTCVTPCSTSPSCPNGENLHKCGENCTGSTLQCRDLMTCATPCNNIVECPLEEDEACPFPCSCEPGNYLCGTGPDTCVPRTALCNEVEEECPGNEDETPCS